MARKKFQAPQESAYSGIIQSAAPADQAPKPKKRGQYRLSLKLPEDYKVYLQEIAWQNRTTVTGYMCDLVKADMEKHPDWRKSLDELNG